MKTWLYVASQNQDVDSRRERSCWRGMVCGLAPEHAVHQYKVMGVPEKHSSYCFHTFKIWQSPSWDSRGICNICGAFCKLSRVIECFSFVEHDEREETTKERKKGIKFLAAPIVIASRRIDRGRLYLFGPPQDLSSSFFSKDLLPTEAPY